MLCVKNPRTPEEGKGNVADEELAEAIKLRDGGRAL